MTVKKAAVAKSQLETAITLWFTGGDPVSIHTLAVAAQDCYRALAAHAKIESPFETWAKSKSKRFQERLRDTQNFFKHGPRELKGSVHLMPLHSEMLMYDAALTHDRLFGRGAPLTFLYCLRFCIENPAISGIRFEPGFEKFEMHLPTGVSREKLYQVFLRQLPDLFGAKT